MLLLLALLPGAALALWPAPASSTNGSTFVKVSPSFTITLSDSLASSRIASSIAPAVSTALQQVKKDDLYWLEPQRGLLEKDAINKASTLDSLTVTLSSSTTSSESSLLTLSEATSQPIESWDETYSLSVPVSGSATLTASSAIGILRGLTTFTQLVYTLPPAGGSTLYIRNAPWEIQDKPQFAWRGVLLDTSRHFFPVDDIKRTLDAASWAKLNTFNWHITDSQSWPLEVSAFPQLSKQGAYLGKVYHVDDVKEVIAYGQSLGIQTVIEIDTPGHTDSIVHSYPDYIACNTLHPWGTYANEPPSGQLRFSVPEVQNFTNALISSVLENVQAAYWGTGGDELNTQCYTEDTVTQQSLSSQGLTLEQALTRFTLSEHATVRAAGKAPVVWEEMVLDHEVGTQLGNDTVVLVWISSADARLVADAGHKIVHAPSDYFYLDCGQGGWITGNPAGNSWCDPFKTWQKIYSFDPYANLTTSQQSLVLGGETALWAEQSDSSNLDAQLWPRSAAAGEVFWTGPGGDANEAVARLHDWRYRAVARGVRAIALQPEWCALRPAQCLES